MNNLFTSPEVRGIYTTTTTDGGLFDIQALKTNVTRHADTSVHGEVAKWHGFFNGNSIATQSMDLTADVKGLAGTVFLEEWIHSVPYPEPNTDYQVEENRSYTSPVVPAFSKAKHLGGGIYEAKCHARVRQTESTLDASYLPQNSSSFASTLVIHSNFVWTGGLRQFPITGSFSNSEGSEARPVSVLFKNTGTGDMVAATTMDNASNRGIALELDNGTYDITFHQKGMLAKTLQNVTITSSTTSLNAPGLLFGDVNSDNVVNTDDYILLSGNFDKTTADPDWLVWGDYGYPVDSDIDNDGAVTTDDFLLLTGSFDMEGDEAVFEW